MTYSWFLLASFKKYNKQLFLRVKQGHYLPNLDLAILIAGKWINIYDLIDLSEIVKYHKPLMSGLLEQILHYRHSESKRIWS